MEKLQRNLRYHFDDPTLITTALTHSSYANERHCQSNERLEFLGDSVLGMITAEWLYANNPDLPEGRMTRLRADLVCEQNLWHVARKLQLGNYLNLGRGEELSGGRRRPSILADCVEAIIAALYLDGGYQVAKDFIHREILRVIDDGEEQAGDYKTILQELIQRKPNQVLHYIKTGETGPDHQKVFHYAVSLNGDVIGTGSGHTKKEAEQQAARSALEGIS